MFEQAIKNLQDSGPLTYDIDPANLEEGLLTISEMISYVCELKADATLMLGAAKNKLSRTESGIYLRAKAGNAKANERTIKALVETSQDVITCNEEVIKLEAALKRIEGRLKALSAKKDALISLANTKMAEMKSIDPARYIKRG